MAATWRHFLWGRRLFRLNWLRFLLKHQTGQTEKPEEPWFWLLIKIAKKLSSGGAFGE